MWEDGGAGVIVRDRRIALAFRAALLCACGSGLAMTLVGPDGELELQTLAYYTVQSNLLVFGFFATLALSTASALRRDGPLGPVPSWPGLKGMVTLAILVTMLVYHFVLVPSILADPASTYRPFGPADLLVHYAGALMALADWMLFDPKPGFRPADPLRWLAVPLAYLGFAIVRARLGPPLRGFGAEPVRYPYGFMDPDIIGAWPMIRNVALLGAGFLALGYAMLGLDRLMARLFRRRTRARPPVDGSAGRT